MTAWPLDEYSSVPSRERARSLAREVRRSCLGEAAADTGWCDLRLICTAAGVSVKKSRFTRDGDGTDALLIPRPNGEFVVLVDPAPPGSSEPYWRTVRHRNRFRIAHELAHVFFYSRTASSPPRRKLAPSLEEEAFCDIFASSLLIPPGSARKYPPTPGAIYSLSEEFEVSLEVAGRALATEHPGVSVVGLLWSPNPRTGEFGPRVVWSASERFIPNGARLRSDAATAVLSGDHHAIREETLALRELEGPHEVEALRPPERKQVLLVARPTSVKSALNGAPQQQLPLWASQERPT